jgi:uncharacterized protein
LPSIQIDLVLDLPAKAGRWWIEIKRGLSRPEKGFYIACEDIAPKRAFMVYSGTDAHPLSHDVEATGVRELAHTLLALGSAV